MPKRVKLYFRNNDDLCYPKEVHLQYMRENFIPEMQIFEAKAEYGTGFFFCKNEMEIGESGESCGKVCPAYEPRNGKNGICKHHGFVYEQTEKSITLKV